MKNYYFEFCEMLDKAGISYDSDESSRDGYYVTIDARHTGGNSVTFSFDAGTSQLLDIEVMEE